MTVFQNRQRAGEWRFDFRQAGKRYTGPCVDAVTGKPAANQKQARQHEALARMRAKVGEKAGRSIARPGTFPIGMAIALHIESQVGSSPAHVANIKLYARELIEFFGSDTPVIDITQGRVDEYRRHAAAASVQVWRGGPQKRAKAPAKIGTIDRKRSPAAVNHRLKCLRAALAQAHRIKDPVTGSPMLPFPPTVTPVPAPKRRPSPMPDAELFARLAQAPPWVRDVAELARYFGLRRAEALTVTLAHIDRGERALRLDGAATKSGRDEFARPVPGGWEVLDRLARQARARGTAHLVTWPGIAHMAAFLAGEAVPAVRGVGRPAGGCRGFHGPYRRLRAGRHRGRGLPRGHPAARHRCGALGVHLRHAAPATAAAPRRPLRRGPVLPVRPDLAAAAAHPAPGAVRGVRPSIREAEPDAPAIRFGPRHRGR